MEVVLTGLDFAFYSMFVLLVHVFLVFLEVSMSFIFENWELIGLILSNIAALFVKRPQDWRSK